MDTTNLDDLELELRKLPGVRAAGFTERDDMLLVQVQVSGEEPSANLSHQAARIAYRHADKPVALEVVRWRTIEASPTPAAPVAVAASSSAPDTSTPDVTATTPVADTDHDDIRHHRVRLLAVLTFPDTDELEVHLTFGGRRIIGRSAASAAIVGAATATVEGLRTFAPKLAGTVEWASELTDQSTESEYVVACSIAIDGDTRLGIASGGSRLEAAARATLNALNRTMEQLADGGD